MDEPDEWVTLAEASPRLGRTVDSLRKAVRRGQIEARKGNDGLVRVRLAASQEPDATEPKTSQRLDIETLLLREELVEASRRADRAEGELGGMREALAEARQGLAKERERADRLEGELRAMLAETRRPWWRRLLG